MLIRSFSAFSLLAVLPGLGCTPLTQYEGPAAEEPSLAGCSTTVTHERTKTMEDGVELQYSLRLTATYDEQEHLVSRGYEERLVEISENETPYEDVYAWNDTAVWEEDCMVSHERAYEDYTRISTFTCDDRGNPIAGEVVADDFPEDVTSVQWTYAYDAQDRITEQAFSVLGEDGQPATTIIEGYAWDENDRRTQLQIDWEGDEVWDETTHYEYTLDNQGRLATLVENAPDYVRTTTHTYEGDSPWSSSWLEVTDPDSGETVEWTYFYEVDCE